MLTQCVVYVALCSTVVLSAFRICASDYIGCYIDGGPSNRLFTGAQQNYPQDLTPEKCNTYCKEKGFAYAGTQYSYECFCSKKRPQRSKKTKDDECNSKCSGDPSKTCGGTNRMSVASTGAKAVLDSGHVNFSKLYNLPPQSHVTEESTFLESPGVRSSEEKNELRDRNYQFIGCYMDGEGGQRLFQGLQSNFPGTLTPNECNKYCFDNGFAYAGTQYSYECFCSRTTPPGDKKKPESECNLKCAGDQTKTCGGNNHLSVYSTGIVEVTSTVDANQLYLGCYRDLTNGSRLMNGLRKDFDDDFTNEMCVKLCKNRSFRYAGIQYGKECYCDNKNPSYRSFAKEEECSMRCPGNLLQICGGSWRISLFKTGISGYADSDNAGKYIGCYKDKEDQRSLKGNTQNFKNFLTPERCTGLCYSMGYLFAGTQNGKECYCGDDSPNPNDKVSESQCSKPCSGDKTKKCGGDYRNSVRQTGIPDVPAHNKYLGCFNDQNNQILKGYKGSFDKTNTPRRCLNFCWQLGFKYAGVEYGKECLCGNNAPRDDLVVSGSECNMACSGDPLDTCGAGWRLAAYSTDIDDEVSPIVHIPTSTETEPSEKPCQPSETRVNGYKVCQGDVVFYDEFDTPLGSKWKHIVMIPDAPDFEFSMFHSAPENSYTSKKALVIKPTLFNDSNIQTGSIKLHGCTADPESRACGYEAFSFQILPPVASARINTKESFSFRYGIIEIRAKLPTGDWLVPELWLEPKTAKYGPDYASGRIRLAMSRGNQQLQCGGQELGNSHLESGVLMGPETNVRSRSVTSTLPDNWHNYYHTYTLIWKPDSISFKIDNEPQQDVITTGSKLCEEIGFTSPECSLWNSGSKIAPFDTDFYISLGLSSGNARDFPDDCTNKGKPKPWKNRELKALLKFWQDKRNWSPTWSDEKSALYVEYVRVTALS